jgi:hypothetical protein
LMFAVWWLFYHLVLPPDCLAQKNLTKISSFWVRDEKKTRDNFLRLLFAHTCQKQKRNHINCTFRNYPSQAWCCFCPI